ncbi:MAG: DUF4440 domain-containing protein [Deltaproteobacteria bacterium]|jgi:hypothetical protein|nr:DUF4440 domain-containing protein [Deltaproteobacteria bacterium]
MASSPAEGRREDELQIRDLAYRYARVMDARTFGRLSEVFSEDAELAGPGYAMRGLAELGEGLKSLERFSATLHCVHNQYTHFDPSDPDRATGEIYCVANHIYEKEGVAFKLDMGIRYDDTYTRTPDGWRLARRVFNMIWEQDAPLTVRPDGSPVRTGMCPE